MGQVRNSLYTYVFDYENPEAEPIQNSNKAVTIGGIVKSQADSERLEIKTTARIKQVEMPDLNLILKDFSREMYYTPSCALYDRVVIEEIKVIMTAPPTVKNRVWDGERVFYLDLKFEEVLSG